MEIRRTRLTHEQRDRQATSYADQRDPTAEKTARTRVERRMSRTVVILHFSLAHAKRFPASLRLGNGLMTKACLHFLPGLLKLTALEPIPETVRPESRSGILPLV